MIIFWILVFSLLIFALVFILRPLLINEPILNPLPRDALHLNLFKARLNELTADLDAGLLERDQYNSARRDLERELLSDLSNLNNLNNSQNHANSDLVAGKIKTGRLKLAIALTLLIPTASILLYIQLGDQTALARIADGSAAINTNGHGQQEVPSLEVLVQRLAEHLREQADDLNGWLMLGRSYFALNEPKQGLAAFERAYQINPTDSEVMLAYAQALLDNQNDPDLHQEKRATELLQTVLTREPTNPTARWLSGVLAYQHGDLTTAIDTWQKLLSELDPASEDFTHLRQTLIEAQAEAQKRVNNQNFKAPSANQH